MHRIAVILVLGLLAAFAGGNANATTSIVSIIPTGIIFAADSKSISDTELRSRHEFSCKIIHPSKVNPGIWMTKAGIDYFYIRGSDELDMSAVAMANISRYYDLYRGATAFGDDFSLRLTYFLIAARLRYPAMFSRLLPRDGATVTETAFGQVLPDGQVEVYVVRFVGYRRAARVYVEPVVVRKSSVAGGVVFLGFHNEIEATFKGRRSDLGSPEVLRRAIEIEARAHPDEVGPPIAILKLDRTGPRWIARGVC
jgi:hypothetical protein